MWCVPYELQTKSVLMNSGHCRRRKIRCIPAPGDVQQRCSNCIRLKKECNFFPVDQPPAAAAGDAGRRESKSKSFRRDSASPPSVPGHSQEMQDGLPYHQLQIPPVQDYGASVKKPRTDSFSPDIKGKKHLFLGKAFLTLFGQRRLISAAMSLLIQVLAGRHQIPRRYLPKIRVSCRHRSDGVV